MTAKTTPTAKTTRAGTWLAVAAGGALLLGAGGTFATWSAEQTLTGGTITTGELALSADALSWTDVSPDIDATPIELDAFRMVPGDVLEGHTTVNTALIGDNLRASLTLGHAGQLPDWLTAEIFLDGDALSDAAVAVDQSRDIPLVVRITLPDCWTDWLRRCSSVFSSSCSAVAIP